MYTVDWNGEIYQCDNAYGVVDLYKRLGIDNALVCGYIAGIKMSSGTMSKSDVVEWVKLNNEV